MFDTALDDARTAAGAGQAFEERLDRVLAVKLELTLRLWRDSPHAAELLDASARLCGDLVLAYTHAMVDLVAAVVTDAATTGAVDLTGTDATSVAEIAVALTRGLEADLTDPVLPRRRLRQAVTLVARGLHPRSAP